MAYRSYSNNKDADKPFEPTVYVPYRMNNGESDVDKTCLAPSLWKQSLKLTIAPRKEGTDEVLFDMNNGLAIYLNHSKARILGNEIKNFLRDPDTYNGVGVTSGQGIITISNGKEFGVDRPILVIRKVDDTGNVISSIAYDFKSDYYFAVRGYTGGKDFVRESASYNRLEVEELVVLLEEYCKAMTYTVAYSVMDANKYNQDRIQSRINSIAEKLGIEVTKSSKAGSDFSSTSYFNNAGGSSSSESYVSATLDDID